MTARQLSEDDLYCGVVLAIEQAGFLLLDALALFRAGSPASAAVLAVFCREELGRSRLLSEMAARVFAGERLTPTEVQKACKNHGEKLDKALTGVSVELTPEEGSLMADVMGNPRHPRYAELEELIARRVKEQTARLPGEHQSLRERALYTDVADDAQWNRPRTVSAGEAKGVLWLAANDYAGRWHQLFHHPDLAPKVGSWVARFTPPAPEWPD
jgi:AbiV family abortive infection protein